MIIHFYCTRLASVTGAAPFESSIFVQTFKVKCFYVVIPLYNLYTVEHDVFVQA